jgi:hypothetical protein
MQALRDDIVTRGFAVSHLAVEGGNPNRHHLNPHYAPTMAARESWPMLTLGILFVSTLVGLTG